MEAKKITEKKKQNLPLYKRKPKFKKTTGRDKEAALLALKIIDKKLKDKEIEKIALAERPKIIIAGATAYSREIDFKKFSEI